MTDEPELVARPFAAQIVNLAETLVEHHLEVGGVVRRSAVAVVFDQFGGFALEGDEGRIGFQQARGDADEVGFDGFGCRPDRQHFDGAQTRIGKADARRLQFGRLGVAPDEFV